MTLPEKNIRRLNWKKNQTTLRVSVSPRHSTPSSTASLSDTSSHNPKPPLPSFHCGPPPVTRPSPPPLLPRYLGEDLPLLVPPGRSARTVPLRPSLAARQIPLPLPPRRRRNSSPPNLWQRTSRARCRDPPRLPEWMAPPHLASAGGGRRRRHGPDVRAWFSVVPARELIHPSLSRPATKDTQPWHPGPPAETAARRHQLCRNHVLDYLVIISYLISVLRDKE